MYHRAYGKNIKKKKVRKCLNEIRYMYNRVQQQGLDKTVEKKN